MKKTILSVLILAAAAAAPMAQAQQKVFLNKGDQVVETIELGEDDYIAFGRPENLKSQEAVGIENVKAGKNYVQYDVVTLADDQPYYQMCVSQSYLTLFCLQYFGVQFAGLSEEEMSTVFMALLPSEGYGMIGSMSFDKIDGEVDPYSYTTSFVSAGETYHIVACDLVLTDGGYALGDVMAHATVQTAEAGESQASLSVEYKGLDESGKAVFDVNADRNLRSLHLVLATSRSIDEFISLYGYSSMMYNQGINFSAQQWEQYGDQYQAWDIKKEADYSFYALGVDENGDWVKASVENVHIRPLVADNCPEVNVTNHQCVDGELAIEYDVVSQAAEITKAKMLVMKENDWDDALNDLVRETGAEKPSQLWAQYMETTDLAVDVTDAVKELAGHFTFTATLERGWYVAVLAVTDEFGTTVTRASFHSHLENAEWEILSRTYPVNQNVAASVPSKSPESGLAGRVNFNAAAHLSVVK